MKSESDFSLAIASKPFQSEIHESKYHPVFIVQNFHEINMLFRHSASNKNDGFSTLSLYVLKRSFLFFKLGLIFQYFSTLYLWILLLKCFFFTLGLCIIILGICVCVFVFVLFLQNDRCLSFTLSSTAFLIHSLQKHHTTATGSLTVLLKHTR